MRSGLEDFFGQLVAQFIFEGRDLILKFFLKLFHARFLLLYGTLYDAEGRCKAARSTTGKSSCYNNLRRIRPPHGQQTALCAGRPSRARKVRPRLGAFLLTTITL